MAWWMLVVAVVAAGQTPTERKVNTRWYALTLDGQRAGWVKNERESAEGRVSTRSAMRMDLKRGRDEVSLELETEFVESDRGEPISMKQVQRMGPTPTTTVFTFKPEGIEMVAGSAGPVLQPLPKEPWLTPVEAEAFVKQRLAAGAAEIEVRTMDPAIGATVQTVTRRRFEKVDVKALGRSLAGVRCLSTTSSMPVETVEVLDADGQLIETSMDMGGMKFALKLATEAEALATAEAGAPELMARTAVKPSKRLINPRSLRKASYVLRVPDGRVLPDLVESGMQRVERLDARSSRVVVDIDARAAGPDGEEAERSFLRATALADARDEGVGQIVETAIDDSMREIDKARALRQAVYAHISKKGLGVGFATASDAARTREGDCTEHAVLLAAALRAAGLPSRGVSGLVYVEEMAGERHVFGYHMWTEALIRDGSAGGEGPVWLTLDATMPGPKADATHIAISTTDLADGTLTAGMAELMGLFGTLEIEVENAE